ncbi:MAG TPA: recombinase family protein [Negativicutes bacterium]|nr:recombinase family protein [Negativicutes bacterium]
MARIIHTRKPTIPAIQPRKRIAAYARVSIEKESMIESLAAQVGYYRSHIQRNPEWQYIGVYADEGITGTKSDRPEFKRLIADCNYGLIDMVITKSLSRFSRNTVDTLNILRELKQKGVDVFFERENIHSSSGDGELMLTILSSFAQEESRSVSENCKWRIRKKMEQGEIVGLRAMYGYIIHGKEIRIETRQAEIVREIFGLYISGESSISIARNLNMRGEKTLTRVAWTPKHVREILKNEKYTGNALLQKTYISDYLSKTKKRNRGKLPTFYVEQSHEAIIDTETFKKAQELLACASENNRPEKRVNARYPFTGKIVCGICGKNYQRKTTKVKISWQCATYLEHGKSACPAKQIPEAILLSATAEALGTESFDATSFSKQIDHIEVPAPNILLFVFVDGHRFEYEWEDRSRAESWTDEMKQAAKERSLAIRGALTCGSNPETGNEN